MTNILPAQCAGWFFTRWFLGLKLNPGRRQLVFLLPQMKDAVPHTMLWLNLGHKTIMKWKYFDQMTVFQDILRDYYSWYLRSWHRMILEHSSVHFFLQFINHLVLKQSLNAEKCWNSNMYTWLEDRKCAVRTACSYFFTFHFCCNGLLFHSTLNHDGDVSLHPLHTFWMENPCE